MRRIGLAPITLLLALSGAAAGPLAPVREIQPLARLWAACSAGWEQFTTTLASYRPPVEAYWRGSAAKSPAVDPERDPAALLAFRVWPELLPEAAPRRDTAGRCARWLAAVHGALDEGDPGVGEVAFSMWYDCLVGEAPFAEDGLSRALIDCHGKLLGATTLLPRINEEAAAFAQRSGARVRPLNDPRHLKIGYDPRWLSYRLRVGGYFYDGWVLAFEGLVADHGFRYEGPGTNFAGCRGAYLALGRALARAHRVVWPEPAGEGAPDQRLALPRGGRIASFGPRARPMAGMARAAPVVRFSRPVPSPLIPSPPIRADDRVTRRRCCA
ncbi:MAG: hypothetical protein EXQ96_06205 [Alphaproteobacteria bacterium]|nr:hypothetical protein [Alphaproteobacteria bacterium]